MKSNKVSKLDSAYPSALLALAQVPEQLYMKGADLEELLDSPAVAIVGSRKVTPYGRAVTARLASELARAGVVIVSGLALGVDSIAHAAALQAGGITIAVLPCGIDTVYPSSHAALAKRIVDSGGALVSEYAGQEKPQKYQFIARNRIIAGLSKGVLIPEAAVKSGSLHTADFALEQGIDVFAVPGNITSPMSEGTNNLIKAGATPVTTAQDIYESLHISPITAPQQQQSNAQETAILSLINKGISDQEELLLLSKLSPDVFHSSLTLLEINGQISPCGPGQWTIQ